MWPGSQNFWELPKERSNWKRSIFHKPRSKYNIGSADLQYCILSTCLFIDVNAASYLQLSRRTILVLSDIHEIWKQKSDAGYFIYEAVRRVGKLIWLWNSVSITRILHCASIIAFIFSIAIVLNLHDSRDAVKDLQAVVHANYVYRVCAHIHEQCAHCSWDVLTAREIRHTWLVSVTCITRFSGAKKLYVVENLSFV